KLRGFSTTYMRISFDAFKVVIPKLLYHNTKENADDKAECNDVYYSVVNNEKFDEFQKEFELALSSTKNDLIMKFPGKVKELEEIETQRLASIKAKAENDKVAQEAALKREKELEDAAKERQKVAE